MEEFIFLVNILTSTDSVKCWFLQISLPCPLNTA